MGILCLIVLFILSIVYPKSKLLTCILAVFMVLTYGLNSYSGDYSAYEMAYNSESIQHMLSFRHYEPLYSILMAICKMVNLNFTGFRIVLAILFVSMLVKGIIYYTEETAKVLALYLVFPFTYFVSVLRAGLASVVILYVSRYLCNDTKEEKLKYIIGTGVAFLLHYSSILFLFALISKKRMKTRTVISIFLLSAILAYLYNYTNLIGSVLGMITGREKTVAWGSLSDVQVNLNIKGLLIPTIVIMSGLFFIKGIRNSIREKDNSLYNFLHGETVQKPSRITEAEFAYGLYYLAILLLPFLITNHTWLRIIWEILVFVFIAYTNLGSEYRISEGQKLGRIRLRMVVLSVWIVILYLYGSGFPSIDAISEFLAYFGRNNFLFCLI